MTLLHAAGASAEFNGGCLLESFQTENNFIGVYNELEEKVCNEAKINYRLNVGNVGYTDICVYIFSFDGYIDYFFFRSCGA